MNDRSLYLKKKQQGPSSEDLAKAIFKTTITAQKLINQNIELINSGEGDIERNRIFLESTEACTHLLLHNLLVHMQAYVNSSTDETLVKIVDKDDSLNLHKDFMKEHERFIKNHHNLMDKLR